MVSLAYPIDRLDWALFSVVILFHHSSIGEIWEWDLFLPAISLRFWSFLRSGAGLPSLLGSITTKPPRSDSGSERCQSRTAKNSTVMSKLVYTLLFRLLVKLWGEFLGNGWSKSIVLDLILGMEPKNQVIWTTRCKVIAKYLSIYFEIFYERLVCHQLDQKQKKIRGETATGYLWPLDVIVCNGGTPSKKGYFQKMWFFRDLGFPLVILVNKPLEALCLSSKMMYHHLLYLISLWTFNEI